MPVGLIGRVKNMEEFLRHYSLKSAVLFLLFAFCVGPSRNSAQQRPEESPLLGKGYGIDHLIVAVNDLEAAKDFYRDTLGFNMRPRGEVSIHPTGTKNTSIYFANQSYLELLAINDREKVAQNRPHYIEFLSKHEGALFYALSTSSAAQTARYLGGRGFAVKDPAPGAVQRPTDKEMPPPKWLTVAFEKSVLPPLFTFFIEYKNTDYQDMFMDWDEGYSEVKKLPEFRHPNTALGISAVWVAVRDVAAASKEYETMGLPAGGNFISSAFDARGVEIKVVRQRVLLLQPQGKSGKVASFLATRGEGVIGVSIEVESLETARTLIERNLKRKFKPQNNLSGKSILIPPEMAHGIWIELHQAP
jgi:catechol 2,3-dioxygenase-like lactoylglutathione lyase family enzyme